MWTQNITADGKVATGIKAKLGIGWHVFGYDGDLGGGTVKIYGRVIAADESEVDILVPDSALAIADVDGDSAVIKQMEFRTFGEIVVELTGASSPDVNFFVE